MASSTWHDRPGVEATGKTFPVVDVEPAGRRLAEASYREAVEGLLACGRLAPAKRVHLPEGGPRFGTPLVAGVADHPLVAALHLAYAGHHPIAISPDAVWLLICQGVAHHVHAEAEQLRPRFVKHPGRLTLEIEAHDLDSLSEDSTAISWPDVFGRISEQVRQHIGPRRDLFLPAFTTTGPTERAAAEIVLLGAVGKYFHDLLTSSVCGIPAITLEGTAADWRQIIDRIDGFADLGLEWWFGPLRLVVGEFVSAATGDADRAFWSSIYRLSDPNGPCEPVDSPPGWIAVLFPYLTHRDGSPTRRNPWLASPRTLDELFGYAPAHAAGGDLASGPGAATLRDAEFPIGLASAPLRWVERDLAGAVRSQREMELVGGFVGVRQQGPSLQLRPEIGWAVREHAAP